METDRHVEDVLRGLEGNADGRHIRAALEDRRIAEEGSE